MISSEKIAYFGYGSLVNLSTLRTPYISAHKAQLQGWRRVWKARPSTDEIQIDGVQVAFLSVERHADTTLEGLILIDHASSLPSLDQREALYDRIVLQDGEISEIPDSVSGQTSDLFVYQHKTDIMESKDALILRSYLDAVAQGYLHHFGEDGLLRFQKTTRNFHLSILEDRDAPIYPRPVSLEDDQLSVIDEVFPPHDTRAVIS